MILIVTSAVCFLLFLGGGAACGFAWVRQDRRLLRYSVGAALTMLVTSITGMILHVTSTFQQLGAIAAEHKAAHLAAGIDGFDLPGILGTAGVGGLLLASGVIWVLLRASRDEEAEVEAR